MEIVTSQPKVCLIHGEPEKPGYHGNEV